MTGLTAAYVQGGGAIINTNGQNIKIAQPLLDGGGGGGLQVLGSGTLGLAGSNTYTGPTTISQGKLLVDGWLTNSAVSVNGGTLGGRGYLSSVTVNPGGQLAPGDAPGTLNVSGSLILTERER